MRATFHTSMGTIVCELFPDETPKTVDNFVRLAQGTKSWMDPKTSRAVMQPLYNDTIFHRVIPNFMIQGGDPLGLGHGGPGYSFEDEVDNTLKFDRPGRLAMANRGPNTNGSQFFITHISTPWLDGKHTIFGQVVEGQDIVDAIGNAPKGSNDRPNPPITLHSVTIE
ncbi:MAG: peptidylprolyl isomerase [candidate division Zixibacteria bacterium]|nr:peptidylprolyl isomerase [candidate division Zixibacteria bacterium]